MRITFHAAHERSFRVRCRHRSVMESGVAMEGMVLVAARAWLLGRTVVNLPTQCSKCVV